MELAILGVLICQLSLLLLSLILAKRLISSLSRNVRSFLEPTSEGQSSPAADIGRAMADEAANRLAAAMIASLKGWLMSQNSIAVRQDKAAARAEFEAQSPALLTLLSKYSPGIGKIISKNPEIAQLALNAFQNKGGKAISDNSNNHHSEFNKI